MNELKMTSQKDASTSIVVSFASSWESPLLDDKVRCVFRKRAPSSFTPDWIYVYVASPRSAIIGRCAVEKCEKVSIPKALKMADSGHIPEHELRAYAFGYEQLSVFHIKSFEPAPTPLTWDTLQSKFSFSAPQSFFVLSEDGKRLVDEEAGFAKRTKRAKTK